MLLLQADRQIVVNDSLMLVRMLESTQACAVGLPLWDPVLEERRGIVTRPLADGKPLWVGWIKKGRHGPAAVGQTVSPDPQSKLSSTRKSCGIHRFNLWIRMFFWYLHKKFERVIVFL